LNTRNSIIYFSEIESWTKIKKSSKYEDYEILYLQQNNKKVFKINGFYYDNSDSLFEGLTHQIPESHLLRKRIEKKESILNGICFLLIGMFFAFLSLNIFYEKPIEKTEITMVKGFLKEPISVRWKRKKMVSFKIKLNNTDNDFIIYRSYLNKEYLKIFIDDFVCNSRKGQEIQFYVKKEEFEKKIARTKGWSYSDLVNDFGTLYIFEFSNNGISYATLKDYNSRKRSRNKSFVIFWSLLGFVFVAAGFYSLKKANTF
jgi:hypothetical protein